MNDFLTIRPRAGFTLIEVLIYIGLFAILMSGAAVGAYELLQGGAHDRALVFAQAEGTFISRKLNWALTGASNASASGAVLTITRPDLMTTLIFDGSGTNLTLARGAGSPVALVSDEFKPTNVAFTVAPAVGGMPPLVTMTFSIHNRPFVFKKYLR